MTAAALNCEFSSACLIASLIELLPIPRVVLIPTPVFLFHRYDASVVAVRLPMSNRISSNSTVPVDESILETIKPNAQPPGLFSSDHAVFSIGGSSPEVPLHLQGTSPTRICRWATRICNLPTYVQDAVGAVRGRACHPLCKLEPQLVSSAFHSLFSSPIALPWIALFSWLFSAYNCRLVAGDGLLLETFPKFEEHYRNSSHFALVSC